MLPPQVALGAKRPAAATPQPAGKALRMDAGAGAKAKAAPASAPPKASGKDGKKQEPATAKQAEPTKGACRTGLLPGLTHRAASS